ncbi:hypothetical protein ACEPAF_2851 [Sanghuangporus sanghuang]
MSDVVSITNNWNQKIELISYPTISTVHNNDDKLVKRWLIPDFTVQRTAETGLLRRSNRTKNVSRSHFTPRGRISQKTVALLEIKPFPDEMNDETISNDLSAARSQLMRQIDRLFAKKTWKKKKKVVVGIWAAGDYWSWRIFKPDDLGIKPASKNLDATYRPPSASEKSEEIPLSEQGSDDYIGLVSPDRDEQLEASGSLTTRMPTEETRSQSSIAGQDADQSQGLDVLHERSDSQPQDAPDAEDSPPIYFVLGTEQSDAEMQNMLQAIYDLPDSREFREK